MGINIGYPFGTRRAHPRISWPHIWDASVLTLWFRFLSILLGRILSQPLADGSDPIDALLEGAFPIPDDVPESARIWLMELRRKIALDDVSPEDRAMLLAPITVEEFIAHWKGARECASSSPSECHFGHYIVAALSND